MKLLDEADCAAIWLPAFVNYSQEWVKFDTVFFFLTLATGFFIGGPLWTGQAFRIFCRLVSWARSALRSSSATGQGTKRD